MSEISFYIKAKLIDDALASGKLESRVIDLIRNSPYTDYFFKSAAKIEWFNVLKDEGYFNPDKNPGPMPSSEEGFVAIPQWNVLPYLEKISQQVSTPGNERYIDELLTIIKTVSSYKGVDGQHIDNYRTWWYFVKILLNLPNDKITEEIIDLIPGWLDSKFDTALPGSEITRKLLPKFLTDRPADIKKAEKIIDYITDYKAVPSTEEGRGKKFRLVIDSYRLKEAFNKYSNDIGKKCSKEVIEKIEDKIKPLLERQEAGTYMSFYDEPEYSIKDPLEMFTYILKRVLSAKAKANVATTEEILSSFIDKGEYFYFPKMALYIMGQNMENHSGLFWNLLNTDVGRSILDETLYFGDELKHLLNNLRELTDERRKILHKKIEEAAERQKFEGDADRRRAVYKQEIYQALSHDAYFNALYDKMKSITQAEPELRPAIGKVEIRHGPGASPRTKEEILEMPNDKLAEYLRIFKSTDPWRETVGGLAELIAEVAKETPEKFTGDLNSFKDTGFIYVYEILKGIKDAWNGKRTIDWDKVFVFIELYINRKEFWEDKFIVEKGDRLGGANHEWIVAVVAELIQDGIRDDSWAFSEEYIKKAEEIIFLILDNLKAEGEKEITDYVTYTLNTPFGKTITALILLALRIARVNDKKGIKPRWSSEFKTKYEGLLSAGIVEAFVNFGRYLPNLYYLDRGWAENKVKNLPRKMDRNWEAFMDGYLSIGTVYVDLYDTMRPHYEVGLSYDFKGRLEGERLIQHICIGYLRAQEKLDAPESLFKKLLDKWDAEQIKEIISFFWMQREVLEEGTEESEKMREKIIEFWRFLYEKYKGTDEGALTREDKQILSSVSKLSAFLQKIDAESYEWLMMSAPYVREDFNSPFFIEYLDALKEMGDRRETATYIANVFLKMLDKITPDYDQEHIRSIVGFLFSVDEDSASKICNIYGSRGYEFLRDIYERYRPASS